jgi:hypothetical protein
VLALVSAVIIMIIVARRARAVFFGNRSISNRPEVQVKNDH